MFDESKFGEIVQFLVDNKFDFTFDRGKVNDTLFYELTVQNYFDADIDAREKLEEWFQNNFKVDITAYDRKGTYWTTIKETVGDTTYQLDIRLIFDIYDHSQWR